MVLAAFDSLRFGRVLFVAHRNEILSQASDAFDYIVIDEFHHAASDSYRRLIEY